MSEMGPFVQAAFGGVFGGTFYPRPGHLPHLAAQGSDQLSLVGKAHVVHHNKAVGPHTLEPVGGPHIRPNTLPAPLSAQSAQHVPNTHPKRRQNRLLILIHIPIYLLLLIPHPS